MKKINVFLYFILFIFMFLGCGPSGTTNNIKKNIKDNNISDTSVPITVERGPIFKATVTDINGNKAINDNLGFSNIYRFATQPSYPITVTGGYIDINRDGKLDENDTKLDINMSSYSNIVSPLTTIVGNNTKIIKELSKYYKISKEEITQEIPSQSSKNAIILSNIVYEALKQGYTICSDEFNQTVEKIDNLYKQNFSEITDLNKLAKLLEKEVIKGLEVKRLTQTETESIESNLSNHEVLANTSFIKNYHTTDNIQDIWNIILKIPNNTNINKFDIGVHIVKNKPKTIGDLLIEGITIKDNKVTNINSLNVFGKKVSGTTGSIGYDSRNDITQNAVAILQGDSLLIKLGYIMEKQDIVSSDSFKRVADYNTTLYISKLDINAVPISDDFTLQLQYNKFHTFLKGTQKINGLVQIGE